MPEPFEEHPVRRPGDDEREPIGPSGQPAWACTLTLTNGAVEFTEHLTVHAATNEGAARLCQEVRLNATNIDIREVADDS